MDRGGGYPGMLLNRGSDWTVTEPGVGGARGRAGAVYITFTTTEWKAGDLCKSPIQDFIPQKVLKSRLVASDSHPFRDHIYFHQLYTCEILILQKREKLELKT